MFKFFRKYNKVILVTGMCLLMVAFLVQGTVSQLFGGANNPTLGRIDGKKLTRLDVQGSAYQLRVLGRIPLVNQLTASMVGNDPLHWHLLLHDAKANGLSAPGWEAEAVLRAVGLSETDVRQMADQMQIHTDVIRETVRQWLIADRYRDLARGTVYRTTAERRLLEFRDDFDQAFGESYLREAATRFAILLANGSQRLSEPMVKHLLQEQRATVSGQVVLIPADHGIDTTAEPSPERLTELFEQYRGDLPTTGQPYGLGYRFPQRVKIHYMRIPIDHCKTSVKIDEADAYEYYQDNEQQYVTISEDGIPQLQSYAEVRDRVRRELTTQRAVALAKKMIKTAQSLVYDSQRTLKIQNNGYRQIPDDYRPLSFHEIADQLQQNFKVKPDVFEFSNTFVPVDKLKNLPGLEMCLLADRTDGFFTNYVRSARELDFEAESPLMPLRLQAHIVSEPMMNLDQSRLLFRLTAIEQARPPESLDEVYEQVRTDALRLTAYEALQQQHQRWQEFAIGKGLAALAAEVGAEIVTVPPTPQRELSLQGMLPAQISGIGTAKALISHMFETAQAAGGTAQAIGQVPVADRTHTVGLDNKLALAIYTLEDFQPITRSQFKQEAAQRALGPILSQTTLIQGDDPLNFDSLAKRVGFIPEEAATDTDEPDPSTELQSQTADASN